MTWAWENREHILDLTLAHLWLSLVPIVVGFVVAVPVGWWAHRSRAGAVILGAGSILYTLPSLPLFVLLPAIIGTGILDPLNVAVALSLYAVALLVRTSADAFASVPSSVLDSATASGYSALQRAVRVELPLAGPVLLAGLRVVSVSTVSLVSVGAIIGVQSLGTLFTSGFQRDFDTEIVIGMVGIVAIALLLDLLLVLGGRLLMPWTRVQKAGAR